MSHISKPMRSLGFVWFAVAAVFPLFAQVRLTEDFENGLDRWVLDGAHGIRTVDSGDPAHGKVLELAAQGPVSVLAKDSEQWGPLAVEGAFYFPVSGRAYIGFLYHATSTASRRDFGCLYVKGNGSYIRANPWRDGNVSRLLYEEYKTKLHGEAAVKPRVWQRFRLEVAGKDCHLYIGDMSRPQITFDLYEGRSGAVGFQPRIVGDPVWIDDVRVTSIQKLSYQGPPIPEITYGADRLLTDWEVMGPLSRPYRAVEYEDAHQAEGRRWQRFETDRRGAVVTGRVTQYDGPLGTAYFRTTVKVDQAQTRFLHITTTDELALWVNGRYEGFVYRDGYMSGEKNDWNAWFDFLDEEGHRGRRHDLQLQPGENRIVVRVRNGQFASGGFFAALEKAP
ncbi:hypothetical protein SCOR_03120 [Sulfidibacter corallicola]|uniref:3-keto-disaccharide hydrolase domain-containing protein n=1 Tax=Sulfidibacter corallicola TaxID=2818388 RepID=A0A8A4TI71_SULCO|nr:hypothetical protein [Sulfidibacter corallicola]QTD48478.1 hypothetical protein J3U87_23105 [Sulfidibacter corallicola]